MATEYLNNQRFQTVIARFQKAKRERQKFQFIIEDLNESKERIVGRKGKCSKHLEDKIQENNRMHEEINDIFSTSRNELADCFYTLSENVAAFWQARASNRSCIDVDDQIQEGVLICFEKIDRFDPDKGRAFNYMTTCILNHYRQLYRSAKHYNDLKKKYGDFIASQVEYAISRNYHNGPSSGSNHYAGKY